MSGTRAREDGPSIGWMLATSLWMLTTVIPGPVAAWLGFLIVGVMGRMPRWVLTGAFLGAAAIVARLPFWGGWSSLAASVVYILGMLLALVANPQWLRARWLRGQAASGAAQRAAVVSGRERAASPGDDSSPDGGSVTGRASRAQRRRAQAAARREADRSRRAARSGGKDGTADREAGAAQTSGSPSSTPDRSDAGRLAAAAGASTDGFFTAPASRPAAESRGDLVDVNTAGTNELSRLPGMSRSKARAVIRIRTKQGGFRTLDAFAMAAELQPHELVRLRDAATCSPPPRGRRTFGRRVDY